MIMRIWELWRLKIDVLLSNIRNILYKQPFNIIYLYLIKHIQTLTVWALTLNLKFDSKMDNKKVVAYNTSKQVSIYELLGKAQSLLNTNNETLLTSKLQKLFFIFK